MARGGLDDGRIGELLAYLRAKLVDRGIQYAEAPSPIAGGRDRSIFAFQLSGASDKWSAPLVLRVYENDPNPGTARREQAVHRALNGLGFPVPEILLACTDSHPLGSPFVVMERLRGRRIIDDRGAFGLGRVLADLHLRLHALDPQPLVKALEAEGLPVFGVLAELQERVARSSFAGLAPGLQWLEANRPAGGGEQVICHGDFHPENILSEAGELTGVLDWELAVVAEPAFDVGNTLVLLGRAEPDVRRGFGWLARLAQRVLASRYYSVYRAARPLDAQAVRYYEAYRCFRSFLGTVEGRWAEGPGPAPWSARRLAAAFRKLTAVAIEVK